MSNYQQFDYKIIDYKKESTLSSYALEQTPLTFIPDVENFGYIKVLWDFGDGTNSTALTAKKYYPNAGKYATNLTIYDCYSNAIISNIVKVVDIKNYLPHTFKVDFENGAYYDDITWKNGKINGPLLFSAEYPSGITQSDIYYRVKNSNSDYYFKDDFPKFQHLKNTFSFYEKVYNNTKKTYEYVEIDNIKIDTVDIHAKIINNDIVNVDSNTPDSFFVGLSGNKKVYFKDDSINKINIDLFFDKRDNNIWDNNLKVTLSANIIENDEVDKFSITSNGLDGEFYTSNSFAIDAMKFANVDIPFVIKIKDRDNFTVKNFAPLSSFNITFSVLSGSDVVSPSYYTITTNDCFDGAMRNTIIFRNSNKIKDVKINAVGTLSSLQGSSYNLSGETSSFDVFPQNFLKIDKINEDFDMTEIFKGLRFQEFLLDNDVLFDDFIGTIFGNISSSYDTLGKKIYEKITNFVQNTQDVDRNEIFSLISQMKMLGTPNNVFENNLFTYPEKIKRILDLFSISENKLLGVTNKFRENFDPKGHTSKDFFGINLGNEINTATYVVSANTPIVALEKFSNQYTLLNTYQPLEYTTDYYPLSSYTYNWGWGLVLPDTYQYSDLDKYYLFFEFNNQYDGTLYGNTVIKNNTLYKTLSSENVLLDEDGIPILDEDGEPILNEYDDTLNYKDLTLNIMLRDTLYQSLSLIK